VNDSGAKKSVLKNVSVFLVFGGPAFGGSGMALTGRRFGFILISGAAPLRGAQLVTFAREKTPAWRRASCRRPGLGQERRSTLDRAGKVGGVFKRTLTGPVRRARRGRAQADRWLTTAGQAAQVTPRFSGEKLAAIEKRGCPGRQPRPHVQHPEGSRAGPSRAFGRPQRTLLPSSAAGRRKRPARSGGVHFRADQQEERAPSPVQRCGPQAGSGPC